MNYTIYICCAYLLLYFQCLDQPPGSLLVLGNTLPWAPNLFFKMAIYYPSHGCPMIYLINSLQAFTLIFIDCHYKQFLNKHFCLHYSAFHLWQSTLNNLKEIKFILAHDFRAFASWSVGPVAFVLWPVVRQSLLAQGKKLLTSVSARKQRGTS